MILLLLPTLQLPKFIIKNWKKQDDTMNACLFIILAHSSLIYIHV